MLRRLGALLLVTVVLAGCGGSSGSDDERVVLVDYEGEEFAMFVAANFPSKVAVLPGQTILFQQQWTGEPHTVTTGTKLNESLTAASKWLALFNGYGGLIGANPELVNPEDPGNASFAQFAERLKLAKPAADRDKVLDAYRGLRAEHPQLPDIDNPTTVPFTEVNSLIETLSDPSFEGLLFAGDDDGKISQNIGQPCYLQTGAPPEDQDKACSAKQQRQPKFTGREAFYNSGILPYDGPRGNNFRVTLADDAKPGTYFFYCAVHGPGQLSEVEVRKPGSEVPSARDVARAGRDEAENLVLPLDRVYRNAVRTNSIEVEGETIKGPFAGLPAEIHAAINEFVPRTIRAKANEPITWKLMGSDHTISFDVPPYLPIIEFSAKRIRINPKVEKVAGGSPELGEPPEEGIWKIDGGTYDGDGFWSSGLYGGDPYAEYTLRISKPGTYNYACLLHPKMVGKVVIT